MGDPAPLLKPGDVLRFANGQVNAFFSTLGKLGIVGVTGVLGPLRESKYPTYYGIELRDGSDVLFLNIPKTLKPEGLTGRQIEVFGILQATKNLQVSLVVSSMKTVVDVAPEVIQEELSVREIFQHPSAGDGIFPPVADLRVSVIHGVSSSVLADFRSQVEDLGFMIEPVPVKLQDSGSIISGIQSARGQVVLLIRGGGNDGEFEVFNRPDVLEAWRDKPTFKISALGHTENLTLLDRLSHKSCATPTAAGRFLRTQAETQYTSMYWQRRAEQAGKEVGEAVQKATAPLLEQNDVLVVRAEGLRKEAESLRLQLAAAPLPLPVVPFYRLRPFWVCMAVAVVCGLLIGLILNR